MTKIDNEEVSGQRAVWRVVWISFLSLFEQKCQKYKGLFLKPLTIYSCLFGFYFDIIVTEALYF